MLKFLFTQLDSIVRNHYQSTVTRNEYITAVHNNNFTSRRFLLDRTTIHDEMELNKPRDNKECQLIN